MTISSSAIRSSISMEEVSCERIVRRASPNFFFISNRSSLIILRTFCSSAKTLSNQSIVSITSIYSSSIFLRSKPVKRCRRISKIAWAWRRLKVNFSTNAVLAISALALLRIVLITASRLSRAIFKPSKIWARSLALPNSYLVRRVITSFWWLR